MSLNLDADIKGERDGHPVVFKRELPRNDRGALGRLTRSDRVGDHARGPSGCLPRCDCERSDSLRVERWTVKTLQDRPTLLPTKTTTIAFLTSRPAPAVLPATRLPFERHIYTVTAAVTLVRQEADGDLHLVLSDGSRTMIAESPEAGCNSGAFPARIAQMRAARAAVRLCTRARVTGVAFFDFKHHQTGVAPNAIELHPVLTFRCLA